MGLTLDVAKVWNEFSAGKIITTEYIRGQTGNKYQKQEISSVLCRFVRRGYARKGKSASHYIKIRNYKSRRMKFAPQEAERARETERAIDMLTLGKSILTVIDDLKSKIVTLREQLSEEKSTVKELVERLRKLDELYKQAQARILELNTGKNKTFKLRELQEVVGGLPKR